MQAVSELWIDFLAEILSHLECSCCLKLHIRHNIFFYLVFHLSECVVRQYLYFQGEGELLRTADYFHSVQHLKELVSALLEMFFILMKGKIIIMHAEDEAEPVMSVNM